MNKQLSTAEIAAHSVVIPLPAPAMTKKEKLTRFAAVIREAPAGFWERAIAYMTGRGYREPISRNFVIFHLIEYKAAAELAQIYHPMSAFDAAGSDPVLEKAGLKRDVGGEHVSVLEGQRFFELSSADLHAFSCNCGGSISNADMASRVESIAARS